MFNKEFEVDPLQEILKIESHRQSSSFLHDYIDILNLFEGKVAENGDNQEEEEIISEIKQIKFSGLLSRPILHNEFIKRINKKFKYKYYERIEDLEAEHSLSDFYDINRKSDVYIKKMAKNEIPLKEEVEAYHKYVVAKDNFLIPARGLENGKPSIGMAYPCLNVVDFFFDEIFFVSSEIINNLWGVRNISFLNYSKNPGDNLENLLTYMESEKLNDLHFFKFNDSHYQFTAREKNILKSISKPPHVPKNQAEELIRALMLEANVEILTKQVEVKGYIKKRLKTGTNRNFRISIANSSTGTSSGHTVSIRKLSGLDTLASLRELKYSPTAIKIINKAITAFDEGLYIVSGSTGQGKTTLLYAILLILQKLNKRIITIENPIEIQIPGIVQFDLTDTETADERNKLTLDKAISIMLRQDPNVALVSEVRNEEEIKTIFKLSNTGHLSFSTIHANSCKGTLKRMQNDGKIEKSTLNLTVKMIINQTLIDEKCQHCNGTGISTNESGMDVFCNLCNPTGDSVNAGIIGRLPLYEIAFFFGLEPDDDIYNFDKLIQEEKLLYISKQALIEQYYREGLVTEDVYKLHANIFAKELIESKDENLL